MVAVYSTAIFIIALLFNSIAYANYGATLCKKASADYYCYVVKRGDTWKKLFDDPAERDLVMRVNRMNTKLHTGIKIALPKSNDLDPLQYAPFPRQIESIGKKSIHVSLQDQAFGAYNSEGTLEFWGPVSSAKGYCPDIRRGCHTPTGSFAIYQKGGSGCSSSKYPVGRGGAPMPYCMFFHKGFAFHGSPDVPGYNASHGCLRIFTSDARWLNQEFTHGERTPVIVK